VRIDGALRFASASKAARRAVSGSAPRVDLAVDPGLVEPGDAGDGADLGIRLGAGLGGRRRVGGLSGGRVGHLCLHANMGAGVGGRRHQGNLVGVQRTAVSTRAPFSVVSAQSSTE
jgi:hypothetical protein